MLTNLFGEDIDPVETQEWLDAMGSVLAVEGKERAQFLLNQLSNQTGLAARGSRTTPYRNTLSSDYDHPYPGDLSMENRIRAFIRWNAMAMVVRAGRIDPDLGGHIGTFASSATLYEVGFNHFWRANTPEKAGDLVYIQGHASPGVYARSFLEGRLSESQLIHFRREIGGGGLSSYPHPWLMPDYWQFPTVSMGLGPLQAIYQARFMRYLEARGLIEKSDRKVWCFCGDGEMDEPESLGAISLASRESLDNLIFVINCNLQRLDGPVRGNGKIIQELEGVFAGAGWNVLKVIWGRDWDPLLATDSDGLLQKRMNEAVDGEYQNFKAKRGAYTREHFFGKYPELLQRVAHLSDEDIFRLKRGGHDPLKVHAAYRQAVQHQGQPTVILAKTVKGYGLGDAGEALNTAHNTKKLSTDAVRAFRDRFQIPISDKALEEVPFYRPEEKSPEMQYLKERRAALGGGYPNRRRQSTQTPLLPEATVFEPLLKSTGDREISTTMAFVRFLSSITKDKNIGNRIVPIVPDEARTFGMEGLFRQVGIYAAKGQLYEPVDSDQVMFYKESANGQILEEGINEAGSMCSWIASATSYSNHNSMTIPFYIYYSMFGFQRVGDLAWAAGDLRSRGFLLGGTSGRTTLNGEGLQHQDGHSHLLASTIPNCVTYDPTFSYELAVILEEGLRRMVVHKEDVYYYITLMNENYTHPDMPEGCREGILKGIYCFKKGESKAGQPHVQLLGCGSILREVIAASELLLKDFGVSSDIWSVTSFNELRRDGLNCEHHNQMCQPKDLKKSYVQQCFERALGPVIASTDYMKLFAEQIRAFMPKPYTVLGTDGFGRSDSRQALRRFFEVDRHYVVYAALKALVLEGALSHSVLEEAKKRYHLDPNKLNPLGA